MKTEKLVATLTVHGASELSTKQMTRLMKWINGQKVTLATSDKLSKRYTAKLWSVCKDTKP